MTNHLGRFYFGDAKLTTIVRYDLGAMRQRRSDMLLRDGQPRTELMRNTRDKGIVNMLHGTFSQAPTS